MSEISFQTRHFWGWFNDLYYRKRKEVSKQQQKIMADANALQNFLL